MRLKMLTNSYISRMGNSNFLDKLIENEFNKKSYGLERLSYGISKIDPFEGKVDGNIWKIVGKKLLRKKES